MSKQLLSSDEHVAPFTALTDLWCVLAFRSRGFPTPSLEALTFFLDFILLHSLFIPIYFSLKITATKP